MWPRSGAIVTPRAAGEPQTLIWPHPGKDEEMRDEKILSVFFGTLLSLIWSSTEVFAQGQEQLRYSVVFSDSKDVTHFRDEYLAWQTTEGTAGP